MPIPNKLTEEDKRTILKLSAEGWPQYKIAARIGVAPNAINRFLRIQKAAVKVEAQ